MRRLLKKLPEFIANPETVHGKLLLASDFLRWKLNVFPHHNLEYYKHQFGRKILDSEPMTCNKRSDFEVHILTCQRDFVDAMWALKTFYYFSGLRPPLVIHDDGSLKPSSVALFKRHFRNCTVISRDSADRLVRKKLKKHPGCFRYRFTNFRIHAIKLFDFYFLSKKKSILFLDSDVLFFRKPSFLIDSLRRKKGFFMSDYRDTYIFPRRHLDKKFHLEMRRKVNTGLVFLPKKYYDLGVIDSFLKMVFDRNMHGRFPHRYWLEQAALAVLISKQGKSFLRLPKEYQISRRPITEETASNHFVSDGSRPLFYTSGLKKLEAAGMLQKLGTN